VIDKSLALKPGQNLCPQCRNKVSVLLDNSDNSEKDEEIVALDSSLCKDEEHQSVSECFNAIGLSPF